MSRQKNTGACRNCSSKDRGVYRSGHCRKCYHWHRVTTILADAPKTRAGKEPYRLRVAKRALKEYAFRERIRRTGVIGPLELESLLYAVAEACRSEVGFAVHSILAKETPESRHTFAVLLLAIIENIPSRLPRLHTLRPPKKGLYFDAWMDWLLEQ